MTKRKNNQTKSIFETGVVMFAGLILLKFIPMQIWGSDILFDASMHITIACFVLYIIYFFVDQNKSWRTPFFIFCFLVLAIISFQRIYANQHNDIGLLGGLLISLIAIGYSQRKNLKSKIEF